MKEFISIALFVSESFGTQADKILFVVAKFFYMLSRSVQTILTKQIPFEQTKPSRQPITGLHTPPRKGFVQVGMV